MMNVVGNEFKYQLAVGTVNISADDFFIALTYGLSNGAGIFNGNGFYISEFQMVDGLLAYEVSGAGYTSGGQALGGVLVAKNDTEGTVEVSAADAVWNDSSITADGYLIYRDDGLFICYGEFPEQVSSYGPFTVPLSGIFLKF